MGLYQSSGNIFQQDTAPDNPEEGWVWIDTSLSTPKMKIYDGSSWNITGDLAFGSSTITDLSGNEVALEAMM